MSKFIDSDSMIDFMSLNDDCKPLNYSITPHGKIVGIYRNRKSDGRKPFVLFYGNNKIRFILGKSNTEEPIITEHELEILSQLLE